MPNGPQGSISQPNQRYTKAECIGRGASKVVYKAFDIVEGIEVAWNEVVCSDACLGSGKERSRMLGEITMLRQLKHRNIMRLYDWWYDKQQQVLVFITELLTDGSLRRFIRRKHAAGITLSVLKRYAWQILQGLVYLHGHYPPIIHRDLKCDNIFVNGASGELKLGDLGFATLLRGMSCPLSVIGTPEFMAPELYDEHYDEKVDIYSYGMCLLELATLEYPYSECTNPAQIYRKVTKGIPPAGLAKVTNEALRDFITLAISSDPTKRPEARQLLVHPFFADVVQAIRAKGWAKGPAPALGAAAAAAAAAVGPRVAAVTSELIVGPQTLPSAGSGRVPLSAPDGFAAIAAAVDAAAAAVAAGSRSTDVPPAQQQQQHSLSTTSEPLAAAVIDAQLQLGAVAGSPLPAVNALRTDHMRPAAGVSCGPVVMQAALSQELSQQQQQQQLLISSRDISSKQVSPVVLAKQQQRQQLPADRVLQPAVLLPPSPQDTSFTSTVSAAGSYPDISTSSISWPASLTVKTGAAAADGVGPLRSSSSITNATTPLHSPFAAASGNSFTGTFTGSSAGSWTGGSAAAAAAAAAAGVPGAAPPGRSRGRTPSLDEMSEEDVLFDADSQGAHTDECDSEHDHYDAGSPAHARQQQQRIHDTWKSAQHAPQQQQQQQQQLSKLDPIREDNDGDNDGDDDVECMCRRIDQQQLSFNVGFFNSNGTRKRVGFQYNADEDTVDDIAVEMLENLSLMPQQAAAIAEKIKAALEALGLPHNGRMTPAQAAAAAAGSSSSNGHIQPGQLAGESVALAIVSTAAASAAIESCSGTPAPGSLDGGSPALPVAAAATGSATPGGLSGAPGISHPTANGISSDLTAITNSGGAGAELAPDRSSNVVAHGDSTSLAGSKQQSYGANPVAAAAAVNEAPGSALDCQQQVQLGAVSAQQLVRELSMLDREAGTALLQNLQEELLVQSLAMPEAAAAVGVELGVTLTGPNGQQLE